LTAWTTRWEKRASSISRSSYRRANRRNS